MPVEEIINLAKEGKYDVIVMGTHGHGFLFHAVIGSTAARHKKVFTKVKFGFWWFVCLNKTTLLNFEIYTIS